MHRNWVTGRKHDLDTRHTFRDKGSKNEQADEHTQKCAAVVNKILTQ